MSANGIAAITGPKISSRTMRWSGCASTRTVGFTNQPSPSIAEPPTTARLPSSAPAAR